MTEQELCERCGFKYGTTPNDCHPGDCSVRPLPTLRAGRDQHGRYYPAARAVEFRARAASLRRDALELEREADELTKLGSVMHLPEVTAT